MVRGKYIIGEFVSKHTVVGNKDDFISAVLARNPKVTAVQTLGTLITSLSPAPDGHAQQGVDSPGTPLPNVITGGLQAAVQSLGFTGG